MEAVDVRGRFVWHQLMTRDVPGAKKFYSKLIGLEGAALAARSRLHRLPFGARSRRGHHGDPGGHARRGAGALAAVHRYARRRRHGRCGGARRRLDHQGAERHAGRGPLRRSQGSAGRGVRHHRSRECAARDQSACRPLGTFSWHELATSDNEAAFAFYSDVVRLGRDHAHGHGSTTAIYLIFGRTASSAAACTSSRRTCRRRRTGCLTSHVPNADDGLCASRDNGGAKATLPPMDVPGGSRIADVLRSGRRGVCRCIPCRRRRQPAESEPKRKPTSKPKAKAQGEGQGQGGGEDEGEAQDKGGAEEKQSREEGRRQERKVCEEIRRQEEKAASKRKLRSRRLLGRSRKTFGGRNDGTSRVIKAGSPRSRPRSRRALGAPTRQEGQGRAEAAAAAPLMTKAVPSTGERLAAIGVGTNNYSPTTPEERAARREVLAGLTAAGASVIDTAPAYRAVGGRPSANCSPTSAIASRRSSPPR